MRHPIFKYGRWHPFTDLERLNRALVFSTGSTWDGLGRSEAWNIPTDVKVGDSEITVTSSLPGIEAANIDVSLDDNVLYIKAKTDNEQNEKGNDYVVRERRTGSFYRALRIPDSVSTDNSNLSSTFKDGILTVTLPREESQKARKIEVVTS